MSVPREMFSMVSVWMKFSCGTFSTLYRKDLTAVQRDLVKGHFTRCIILSSPHPQFRRHLWDGALGSWLRVKMARCSILRQLRSSVASESGVPREAHMIGQGIKGPPKRLCHAASQLERAMVTW